MIRLRMIEFKCESSFNYFLLVYKLIMADVRPGHVNLDFYQKIKKNFGQSVNIFIKKKYEILKIKLHGLNIWYTFVNSSFFSSKTQDVIYAVLKDVIYAVLKDVIYAVSKDVIYAVFKM